jgi:hypothetical protein
VSEAAADDGHDAGPVQRLGEEERQVDGAGVNVMTDYLKKKNFPL